MKNRYNSLRTLYTAIEDARTLGLKEYEIDEQLKIAKVANRDMVMMGMFRPIEPNQDVIDFSASGTQTKSAQPISTSGLTSAEIGLTGQNLKGQFSPPKTRSAPPSILEEHQMF